MQGDIKSAIRDYNRALDLKPDFVEAYFSRADANFDKGKFNKAIKDYTTTIKLKPCNT